MIRLTRITVYPIKALDPMDVAAARIVEGGGLEHDRAFAMVDQHDKLINGKRTDRVHLLRTSYAADVTAATFRVEGTAEQHRFDLHAQRGACEAFLSDYFSERVRLKHAGGGGFPDDPGTGGPTIVSAATLAAVASWYDSMSPGQVHRRMRPNLVVDGADAFWEDLLVSDLDHCVAFRLGAVELEGVSACGRCVVPTRDPLSGDQLRDFQHVFMARREQSFRPDVARTGRFNHLYRLTTRTRTPVEEWGKSLHVGDGVMILGPRPLSSRPGG